MGVRRWLRRRRGLALTLVLALAAAGVWLRVGSLPDGLLDGPSHPSTVVVDRTGVPLYEALSSGEARTERLDADSLPPLLVAATLAAEDRRFWWHPGVDPLAILRAAAANAAAGSIVEGGSTITQQVAKLLLARAGRSRPRSVAAKVEEAVIALRLEHHFTKRELLAMYFNLASYGGQYVGAERASRGYLGIPSSMATPAQAAFLAGLPQRPSGFNPYRHREAAIRRQRTVLARMAAAGALSDGELAEALEEHLTFTRPSAPFLAPHFVEMVLGAMGDLRPPRIQTTLDARLQGDVTGILESHRQDLRAHGASNVAVVVLDNATGEWLAWEGSGDYFDATHGGTLNGPTIPRQPGSALKPFTYALAFEQGYEPASVLPDVPSSFPTAEAGIVYSPRNYDGRYRGPLLARRALAGSENVPAVALAAELGVPSLLRLFARSGITTLDRTAAHYGLGVTLGNAEVRLDELVAAYAAFARGGEWMEPAYVRTVDGFPRNTRRLVSPRTAFWVTDILADADARAFIFGRGGSLELPFPVAVKTGTSQAYHDNWTVGYSRQVTVGVWVGNFDRTPLRNSSGVTGAAPIFHAVMLAADRRAGGAAAALSSAPLLPVPHDSVRREVCALSGLAAHSWCPVRHLEWVAAERVPVACSWHRQVDGALLTLWPPEYRQWARSQGRHVEAVPVDRRFESGPATVGTPAGTHALTIVSPPADATYLIDPTLRREFQTLPLRVSNGRGGRVDWMVSGRTVGSAGANDAVDWSLVPGRHRIVARDESGRTAETMITVR